MSYIKIHRTEFVSGFCKGMSFEVFQKGYAHLLGGSDAKECFKKLGGTFQKPKSKKETD